jgi:hypothetical protein
MRDSLGCKPLTEEIPEPFLVEVVAVIQREVGVVLFLLQLRQKFLILLHDKVIIVPHTHCLFRICSETQT